MTSSNTSEIFVPQAKYSEIDQKMSCTSLVERNTCQTFFWQNQEWVAIGAMGNGTGRGWAKIWAYQIVDLDAYKGDLIPLEYGEHHKEIDKGNRERAYTGQTARTGKRTVVFIGPEITFKLVEVGKQLVLF